MSYSPICMWAIWRMKTKKPPDMAVLVARMEETQAEVLGAMRGKTAEDLFWARTDLGKEYLRTKYGRQIEQKIQQQREFWTWWRWIWHENDVAILDWLIEKRATLDWDDYLNAQLAKAMRMEPERRLLKDWMSKD